MTYRLPRVVGAGVAQRAGEDDEPARVAVTALSSAAKNVPPPQYSLRSFKGSVIEYLTGRVCRAFCLLARTVRQTRR